MENKDKEKKDEQEKKEKDNKSTDQQLKDLEKEIQNLLDDMNVVLGDEQVPNIKILSTEKPKKKETIILMLVELLISIVLMVGLTGYIKWFRCDELYIYFLVILGIGILDILGNWVVHRFFIKWIFHSFGSLLLIPKIIIFVLTGFLVPLFGTLDIARLIIVALLYTVIKSIIMRFVRGNKSIISFKAIQK